MRVRAATPEDWPAIWSFARVIWGAGDTFTYDEAMDEADARGMWMVGRPGRTTVAVGDEGDVIGSANMYANRARSGRARRERELHPPADGCVLAEDEHLACAQSRSTAAPAIVSASIPKCR